MSRRVLAMVAVSAALTLGASSTAWAHECFIANRSAQGNAGATHSSNWVTDTVEGFAHSPGFPPGVDPECFIAYWTSHGGPSGFTVRIDKTIGEGSSNPNLADGRGLDHIEEAYGALLGAALQACAE